MGSLIAPFDEKGNLQTHTTSGDSLTSKSGKNKNTVDSDMFLTLLVAEMQNQDPLEPTSNTEWVSQYATFTQVQKMSEMAEALDVLRANELIGKEVIMKTTSESTGEVTYTQGIVDFIEVENGKPLLVIDDKKYSIADLDTVVSTEYSKAYEKYSTFKEMIDALPDVAYADKTYKNVIQGAFDYYNTMDDYQKNYMKIYGSDQMEKFTTWKLELENMGVKFTDSSAEEEEQKTSLDDILESFNTKMNAILDKLDKLNTLTENNSSDKTEEDSDKKPEEIPDKPEEKPGDAAEKLTEEETVKDAGETVAIPTEEEAVKETETTTEEETDSAAEETTETPVEEIVSVEEEEAVSTVETPVEEETGSAAEESAGGSDTESGETETA